VKDLAQHVLVDLLRRRAIVETLEASGESILIIGIPELGLPFQQLVEGLDGPAPLVLEEAVEKARDREDVALLLLGYAGADEDPQRWL
jgi:hypothetical protein